jgi:aryl sulfotransferase
MLIRKAQRRYRTWIMDGGRWDGFVPRAGDIVIATAPKCGTTWMQQIVSGLVFNDPRARSLDEASPWVEARRVPVEQQMAQIEAQSHRRFLKSHLPLDGLPLFDEVKYIHVARDGRDVMMSMHNHFGGLSETILQRIDATGLAEPEIGRPFPRLPEDPREYFLSWISTGVVEGHTEGTPEPSFFNLELSYWSERHRPNLLLVHYNDLLRDLDGEMRRVAAFLEIVPDEAMWPKFLAAATLESMRNAGQQLMPRVNQSFVGGAERFFNKGVNGRWRDVFNATDQELYTAKVREKFTPGLAAWVERGRLETCDPRYAPD